MLCLKLLVFGSHAMLTVFKSASPAVIEGDHDVVGVIVLKLALDYSEDSRVVRELLSGQLTIPVELSVFKLPFKNPPLGLLDPIPVRLSVLEVALIDYGLIFIRSPGLLFERHMPPLSMHS
jgi:hypothetical protein